MSRDKHSQCYPGSYHIQSLSIIAQRSQIVNRDAFPMADVTQKQRDRLLMFPHSPTVWTLVLAGAILPRLCMLGQAGKMKSWAGPATKSGEVRQRQNSQGGTRLRVSRTQGANGLETQSTTVLVQFEYWTNWRYRVSRHLEFASILRLVACSITRVWKPSIPRLFPAGSAKLRGNGGKKKGQKKKQKKKQGATNGELGSELDQKAIAWQPGGPVVEAEQPMKSISLCHPLFAIRSLCRSVTSQPLRMA